MSFESYPKTRLSRTRQTEWSRKLIAENTLSPSDLIWPVFIHDRDDEGDIPIESMPGVFRYSLKSVPAIVRKATELGIPAIALFPNISSHKKDSQASEAVNPSNIVLFSISTSIGT